MNAFVNMSIPQKNQKDPIIVRKSSFLPWCVQNIKKINCTPSLSHPASPHFTLFPSTFMQYPVRKNLFHFFFGQQDVWKQWSLLTESGWWGGGRVLISGFAEQTSREKENPSLPGGGGHGTPLPLSTRTTCLMRAIRAANSSIGRGAPTSGASHPQAVGDLGGGGSGRSPVFAPIFLESTGVFVGGGC